MNECMIRRGGREVWRVCVCVCIVRCISHGREGGIEMLMLMLMLMLKLKLFLPRTSREFTKVFEMSVVDTIL